MICEAYEVLSNVETRSVYDQYGEQVLKEGLPSMKGLLRGGYAYQGNCYEIFNKFFGTSNPYCDITLPPSAMELKKQVDDLHVSEKDIEVELPCSLLEMMHGAMKKISFTRTILNEDQKSF